MHTHRAVRLSALTLTALVTACGGRDTVNTADAEAKAPPATTASRSACDLVTADEMAALSAEPIDVKPGKSSKWSSKCEYWGRTSQTPRLMLTVTWTGGRETWETWAAAKGMAEDLMRTSEGVSVDSIVAPGPVQGLGDAAIYSELVPALVLKGDVLLEMNVFYLPKAKSQFRGLAELMLGRL
jgi:hypothetical protein